MNELLNIVIDFNLDYFQKLDFNKFIDSLTKFLSCYQLQSSQNIYRVYLAFQHNSYLFFPLDELNDQKLVKKFAFTDIKQVMVQRLFDLLNNSEFNSKMHLNDHFRSKHTSISSGIMKAVCFSRGWIDNITLKQGDQFSCRILVMRMSKEDPGQYAAFVNALFAAQKYKIAIDGIVISSDPVSTN